MQTEEALRQLARQIASRCDGGPTESEVYQILLGHHRVEPERVLTDESPNCLRVGQNVSFVSTKFSGLGKLLAIQEVRETNRFGQEVVTTRLGLIHIPTIAAPLSNIRIEWSELRPTNL